MDRRDFMTTTGAIVTATALSASNSAEAQDSKARDYYELRHYTFASEDQIAGFHTFMEEAAIPAYNRIGINPVGVFTPQKEDNTMWVLIRHTSLESFATATSKLLTDKKYLKKGAAFLDADPKTPAYTRIETTFMKSFAGIPTIEQPVTSEGRVFEVRNYHSPTVKAGQKKIEMFNNGEIDIMRRVGMGPVVYGEHLTGPDMPNLTYILSYPSMRERGKAWGRFGKDPAWKEISSKPEYANSAILSGIESFYIEPTEYSQI